MENLRDFAAGKRDGIFRIRDFATFFNAPEVYQPPKGGESFEEVRARLNNFLEELYQKEELQDKNVLLSTHGAALCGILSLMKGLPISGYWQQGVHKNLRYQLRK
ncbi:MAG: histidine phosphatase family protein [Coprococcus sp.]